MFDQLYDIHIKYGPLIPPSHLAMRFLLFLLLASTVLSGPLENFEKEIGNDVDVNRLETDLVELSQKLDFTNSPTDEELVSYFIVLLKGACRRIR